MKIRLICTIALILAVSAVLPAQDSTTPPSPGQDSGQGPGSGGRQGRGQDGGRRGWGEFGEMGGRGVAGTVTQTAADHYTVRTEAGETYVIHFSANTRILKQTAQKPGERAGGPGGGERGMRERPAPETIKSTDIKTGDAVAAMGEVDPATKSVGAVMVMLIDPERAKQMREQQANFGKTWLMGKVTAINETTVSLTGALDNAAHAFQADENTTFRKRRAPITLADIQVGDMVRVEGAVKGGAFMATSVAVMGMPPGGPSNLPRDSVPATAAPASSGQPK